MIVEAKTGYACDFCGKGAEVSGNTNPKGWGELNYVEIVPLGLVPGVPTLKRMDLCPECLNKVLDLGAVLKK